MASHVNPDYIIINVPGNSVNDVKQYNDPETEDIIKFRNTVRKLKEIPKHEQKSIQWLKQRSQFIGGSEAGTLIDANHYEPYYKLIVKKISEVPFLNFSAVYVGNKYETIATMLYEYLMNVRVDEYGFIPHNNISFIGASPDGIIGEYKYDKKHKTGLVGRMVEIKCAVTRKINMDPTAELLEIVPIYYYPQVQQQLEVCDLEECDFWQVKPTEYNNRKEFEEDISSKYPFKTKDNKFKGCVIQILPIDKFKGISLIAPDKKLQNKIYANAKFIYPPRLDMTFEELRKWVKYVKNQKIPKGLEEYYQMRPGFGFHKVFYWKVDYGRCVTCYRDREWFKKYYPKYEKTWEYVMFLREHPVQKNIILKYIEFAERNKKFFRETESSTINDAIIKAIDQICTLDINSEQVKKICENAGLRFDDNGDIESDDECEFPGYVICND